MDGPVAVAKCCTHSIMLAMLPHRVVVPATNAWLFRTSTAICPNWCVPSCKPRAEIASVTRTRPITTDDSYLLLFLLQHNRVVVSLLWISLHMPACMQQRLILFTSALTAFCRYEREMHLLLFQVSRTQQNCKRGFKFWKIQRMQETKLLIFKWKKNSRSSSLTLRGREIWARRHVKILKSFFKRGDIYLRGGFCEQFSERQDACEFHPKLFQNTQFFQ